MSANETKSYFAVKAKKASGDEQIIQFGGNTTVNDMLTILDEEEIEEVTSMCFIRTEIRSRRHLSQHTAEQIDDFIKNPEKGKKKKSGKGLLAFFDI